jgi:protein TonB
MKLYVKFIKVTKIFPNEVKKIEKPVLPKVIQQSPLSLLNSNNTNPKIVEASQATPDIAKTLKLQLQ